jgi:hypothetical protein
MFTQNLKILLVGGEFNGLGQHLYYYHKFCSGYINDIHAIPKETCQAPLAGFTF